MSESGTSQPFSRLDWRKESKRLFRVGCASLNVEYPAVAAACDENLATVKAWAAEGRDHSVPEWAMVRLRQVYPALAAYIDEGMRRCAERAPTPSHVEGETAKTIEACCRGSALLVSILPDGVEPAEARTALPSLYEQIAQLQRTARAYEALAKTDAPSVGGAQ